MSAKADRRYDWFNSMLCACFLVWKLLRSQQHGQAMLPIQTILQRYVRLMEMVADVFVDKAD